MEDETNTAGLAGESKPGESAEEPHILEERIVKVPPANRPTPVVVPAHSEPAPAPPITISPPPIPANNISSILAAIKLPGRRVDAEVPSAEPKQKYDTSLAIDPKKEIQIKAQEQALQAARNIGASLSKPDSKANDVRALHTLKDDLQEVVRDKKISLVRAVALEEEKRHHGSASEEHTQIQAEKAKRTRFGIVIASLFFFVGLLAIGAVLYVMQERTGRAAAPLTAQVLFAEQSVPLALDTIAPADIRRQIAAARNSGTLTLGAILQIVPTIEGVEGAVLGATFSQFIDAIGAQAPGELTRALAPQFFLGLHTVDENAPLIVVPVESYERAFAAMLSWEKTMNNDLSPIFTSVSNLTTGENGVPRERFFEDTVMSNYDVRALKDDAGVIQLYYSFPTRNVLIIAESPYSFTEILSRLRADRKL